MSYQEKCEKLYLENKIMKSTLEQIEKMEFNISSVKDVLKDLKDLKALVRNGLTITGGNDE